MTPAPRHHDRDECPDALAQRMRHAYRRALEEKRERFRANIRWDHLDHMPKCEHGRVEGFCRCFDEADS